MPSYTKKAIEQSFLKLLNERSLSRITVKDIVEDCNVNRNSFYYHFQDIPSLLDEVIKDDIDRIVKKLPGEFGLIEGVELILTEIMQNKRALIHIWSSPNHIFYEQNLMRLCDYTIRQYVASRSVRISIAQEDSELLISFMKCSFFGIIVEWLNGDAAYDLVSHGRRICLLLEEYLEYLIKKNGRIFSDAGNDNVKKDNGGAVIQQP